MLDRADVLPAEVETRLEQRLARFERETSHQIVVHTTPSLEGLVIEDYSIRLAEAWKVGHKGLDNGLILTVAPEERKVRIEVGYGLEGVVPDAVASRIVRNAILPRFRSGDFAGGILAGVENLEKAALGEVIPLDRRPRPPASRRSTRGSPDYPVLVWLIVLVVFGWRGLFFLPFLGGGRHGRSGWGGGGGFGGGGGGFGGGGGGFGGGGASGGW